MLPEDGDENEDRSDKDNCEGDLGDGAGWERLDVALGTFGVLLFVPAWESGEKDETYKGEDDGNDATLVSVSLLTDTVWIPFENQRHTSNKGTQSCL